MSRSALKRRGFLLMVSLLVLIFLLLLGMGMMTAQTARYRGVNRCQEAAQAFQLAQAGLEDIRFKLEVDPGFPPNPGDDQPLFNYAEDVTIGSDDIGSYEVVLDREHQKPPYQLMRVTSTGTVGPKEHPIAQRILKAELQRVPEDDPTKVVWRWVSFEDLGGI